MSMQNAAACSLYYRVDRSQTLDGTTTIMPVLHHLHWLPIRKRVDLKMATLVYRSLSGMALSYLAADCQLSSE